MLGLGLGSFVRSQSPDYRGSTPDVVYEYISDSDTTTPERRTHLQPQRPELDIEHVRLVVEDSIERVIRRLFAEYGMDPVS